MKTQIQKFQSLEVGKILPPKTNKSFSKKLVKDHFKDQTLFLIPYSEQQKESKLSIEVKKILLQKGCLVFFNYSDFLHFKFLTKKEFNRAEAIAQLFQIDNDPFYNDYNGYIF